MLVARVLMGLGAISEIMVGVLTIVAVPIERSETSCLGVVVDPYPSAQTHASLSPAGDPAPIGWDTSVEWCRCRNSSIGHRTPIRVKSR
jgi:hypothetical protein